MAFMSTTAVVEGGSSESSGAYTQIVSERKNPKHITFEQ